MSRAWKKSEWLTVNHRGEVPAKLLRYGCSAEISASCACVIWSLPVSLYLCWQEIGWKADVSYRLCWSLAISESVSFFCSTKTAVTLRTFQNWENLDMQNDFLGVLNKHEWRGTGATMCKKCLGTTQYTAQCLPHRTAWQAYVMWCSAY